MNITKKLVYDSSGKPSEVLIPYDQFVELAEACALDLDDQEQLELREAMDDSLAGNREAFVSSSEV